jgi:CheY-like chemotaxis protein
VTVPLSRDAALPEERSASSPRIRRRVLLIEDNAEAAGTFCELLELGGHEVDVAHTGREGLAKARALHPDVVLCDIGLPGMDGYEVARALRSDESLRATCLVALSGYALPRDIRRASEVGFDHHLAKPPSLEKLAQLFASIASSRADGPVAASGWDGSPPAPPAG